MASPASLEDLIISKLSSLGLTHDESTASFVQGIIEEESFEPEDKLEAIVGMLEIEHNEEMGGKLSAMIVEVEVYREELAERLEREEEERKAAKLLEDAAAGKAKVLTPEEETARKLAFVKSYAYLEDEDEKEQIAKAEADKAPTSVFVDPKLLTKKARKKGDAGVDTLMQPNLNAAIVKGAEAHRRAEDAKNAATVRDRNKNDLKKQKDDAVKKAEDKKKKAQKVERRA